MASKYGKRNSEGDHRIKDDDPAAIALLKEEHHRFRELFDAAESANTKELYAIGQELCLRLAVHMTIEEEILYPALKGVIDDDEINEGVVEHAAGKTLAAEIEQLDGTEELYKAKIHVLGEETIHHVDEEDEDMFEDAKQAHRDGRIDLDKVGEELRRRQAELYDQVAQSGETGPTQDADAAEVPTV